MPSAPEPGATSRPIGAVGATLILAGLLVGTFGGIELIARVRAAVLSSSMADARAFVVDRPIFGGLAQLGAGAVVLAACRRIYFPGLPFGLALGLRPVAASTLGLSALLGCALQLPLGELGNLVAMVFPIPFEEKARLARILAPTSFGEGLALVLAVVALAPITEELVFRGLLLPGIARGSGMQVAVLISTLGFALSHGRPAAASVAFVGGLLLATLTYRHDSILPAIAMHAAHNAVPVLIPARAVPVPGWNQLEATTTHVPVALWLPSLVLAGVALYLLLREAPGE